MYVSYLLEKDTGMYANPVRHPNLTANHYNFVSAPPQYSDYTGYHHVSANDPQHGNQSGNPAYAPSREEWSAYGHATGHPTTNPGTICFTPRDVTPILPLEQGMVPSAISSSIEQLSPDSQRINTYHWMRRNAPPENAVGGKTRTKDKYRVVYSDHQRLELEKEFHYSRYITIRRKTELSVGLSLSERQVKIWFQNRRAKERKINKKKMQLSQQASTTTPSPPGVGVHGNVAIVTSTSGSLLTDTISMTIKEEY